MQLLSVIIVFSWVSSYTDAKTATLDFSNAFTGLVYGVVMSMTSILVVSMVYKNHKHSFARLKDERYEKLSLNSLNNKLLIDLPWNVVFEELIFRGAILTYLISVVDQLYAILLSSTLFALWHIFSSSGLQAKHK